ncbi:MAG: hypothetical protein Q4C72_07680 [Eubacteriales bacterium]|nr:hypothetical protein [Eubacteriales bacterium]
MKKITVLLLLTSLLFLLCACGEKQFAVFTVVEGENPPASEPVETTSPVQETPDSGTAMVSAIYADEAFFSDHDAFDEFSEDDSEYSVKVAFTTDAAVEDFKFLRLGFVDADETGKFQFEIAEELYTLEELSPQCPLVVDVTLEGIVPDRGISYVDQDGAVKYYALQMSGKDDSLLLTEFDAPL